MKATHFLWIQEQTENIHRDSLESVWRPAHCWNRSNVVTCKYPQCCYRCDYNPLHTDDMTPKFVHELFPVCACRAPVTLLRTNTKLLSANRENFIKHFHHYPQIIFMLTQNCTFYFENFEFYIPTIASLRRLAVLILNSVECTFLRSLRAENTSNCSHTDEHSRMPSSIVLKFQDNFRVLLRQGLAIPIDGNESTAVLNKIQLVLSLNGFTHGTFFNFLFLCFGYFKVTKIHDDISIFDLILAFKPEM